MVQSQGPGYLISLLILRALGCHVLHAALPDKHNYVKSSVLQAGNEESREDTERAQMLHNK